MASKIRFERLQRVILAALVPGGGHLLLGKWIRASVIFCTLFVVLGFAAYAFGKYFTSSTRILSYRIFEQGKVALAIGVPLWALSIADAIRLASRPTEERRVRALRIRWREFRIALPDLSVAFLFALALLDYRSPLVPGLEFWPPYAYWGFFEVLALPVSPVLVNIVTDPRRGIRSKAFEIGVMIVAFGWITFAMNLLFGINIVLFIVAKAVTLEMEGVREGDKLQIQRRAGMCLAAFFLSGVGLMMLKAWLSWTDFPLVSPTGELEMLAMGLIYFLLLAGMNVWWLRRQMRREVEAATVGLSLQHDR